MVALLAATLSGCSLSRLSNLEFTKDDRLDIRSPQPRQLVKTPLTVTWSLPGFDAVGLNGSTSTTAGAYGVFVDETPFAVGKNLTAVGKDDLECKHDVTHQCTSESFLEANNVYVTTKTTLTLPFLPKVADGVGDEQHEITIVLLDGTGTRRTESAWYVDFRYPRRVSS